MVVVFFTKEGYNPLGSDGTFICNDLKTIRGLQRRMNSNGFVNCTHYDKMMIMPYERWRKEDVHDAFKARRYPIYNVGDFQYSKKNLLAEKGNDYKGVDSLAGKLI